MIIEFKGVYGWLIPTYEETVLFERVRKHFSVLDPKRYQKKAFRDHYWDGYNHAITPKGRFLRGMAEDIAAVVRQLGGIVDYTPYNLGIREYNKKFLHKVDKVELACFSLADHQKRCLKALLENGGGTIKAPTGSGKSALMCALHHVIGDEPVFFIVHRKGLSKQMMEDYVECFPKMKQYCGMLADSKRPGKRANIIFSTIQSLLSTLEAGDADITDKWQRCKMVALDECHRVTDDRYLAVLKTLGDDVAVYQASGTPETDDQIKDWDIIGVGGPIVCKINRPELEKTGFIAMAVACVREFPVRAKGCGKWLPKPTDHAYEVEAIQVQENGNIIKTTQIIPAEGDKKADKIDDTYVIYPDYARDKIILDEKRNHDIIAFIQNSIANARNPLVLCARLAQCYYLKILLDQSNKTCGFKANIIEGATSLKERDRLIKEYENGTCQILLASTVLDEGQDIQNVGSVVLAAGGASLVQMVQRIGRGVRRKKNGLANWVPIWFPSDNITKFSKEHTLARLEFLIREEITVEEIQGTWESEFERLITVYGK